METKDSIIKSWLEKAKADELTFYWILKSENDLSDTAAFHAQQAVEKWLKSILILHEVTPPRVHDILLLVMKLTPFYPELGDIEFDKQSRLLNEYAVDVRYPVEFGFIKNNIPDIEQLEKALILFKTFTQQKLPTFAL